MPSAGKGKILDKVKFIIIGVVVGLVIGIGSTIFLMNYNPADEKPQLSASVVFDRIVSKSELVSACQSYNITDKSTNVNDFFGLFDLGFTQNSFWYRYVGLIKAGVNLEDATYAQSGNVITVTLDQPYIISNTPNMEESRVLEENNNILNPIHIEDVDAFRALCVEKSEAEAISGGLFDEAKQNAEQDIRDMFNAALGDSYTIEFNWLEEEASNEPTA